MLASFRAVGLVSALVVAVPTCGLGQMVFDHRELRPERLHGRVLVDYAQDTLEPVPSQVLVVGSFLVLINSNPRDSALLVLNRHSGQSVSRVGGRGEAIGSFTGAWSLAEPASATQRRDRFWVYDLPLRRLTLFRLRATSTGAPVVQAVRYVSLTSDVTTTDPAIISDSLVAALGFFRAGRIGLFRGDGTLVQEVGALPPNPSRVPARVIQHAYQGTLIVRPDRSRLAVVSRHASRLELYLPSGDLIGARDGPYRFSPTYEIVEDYRGDPIFAPTGETRFGYVHGAATDQRIYALFSGRTRAGFPGRANFGSFIHVFDWNGAFLMAYELDGSTLAVALDPGGTTLYAIRAEPTYAVVAYALPRARGPASQRRSGRSGSGDPSFLVAAGANELPGR